MNKKYFFLAIISLIWTASFGQTLRGKILYINSDTLVAYNRHQMEFLASRSIDFNTRGELIALYHEQLLQRKIMVDILTESLSNCEAESEIASTIQGNLTRQIEIKNDELKTERAKNKLLKVSFVAILSGIGAAFTLTKL